VSKTIEVFADITCPFTHVGLSRVAELLGRAGSPVELRVRAWPLEWVNGTPMDGQAVVSKAASLRDKLGLNLFTGTNPASAVAGNVWGSRPPLWGVGLF